MQAVQKPTTGAVVYVDFARISARRDQAARLLKAFAPRKLRRELKAMQRRDVVRQAARAAL